MVAAVTASLQFDVCRDKLPITQTQSTHFDALSNIDARCYFSGIGDGDQGAIGLLHGDGVRVARGGRPDVAAPHDVAVARDERGNPAAGCRVSLDSLSALRLAGMTGGEKRWAALAAHSPGRLPAHRGIHPEASGTATPPDFEVNPGAAGQSGGTPIPAVARSL